MDTSSKEKVEGNRKNIVSSRYREAYQDALRDREAFWSKRAETMTWYKKWDKVLDDSNKPFYKWFPGGLINACYNTLDVHVEDQKGEDVAIKFDSPMINEIRYITYNELLVQVSKLAGALLSLGVQMGDRVLIYMPTIPESMVAMLACARIGAIHVQVFGGYSAAVLSQRMQHTEPKILITATYGLDSTKVEFYQPKVEEALKLCAHRPQKCIVYIRPGQDHRPLIPDRDISWEEAIDSADPCECVPIEATHPLFILHTSGTTGTPKAVIADTGGVMAMCSAFRMRIYPGDEKRTAWFHSNLGWMGGNICTVYGTLCAGNSSVIYEGKAVGTPDASAFYRVISQHNVTFMFASPAHFRAIRKEDPEGRHRKKYKDWSLKIMLLGGEPVSPDIQLWVAKAFTPLAVHVGIGQSESGAASSWPFDLGLPLQQPLGTCGVPHIGADVHIFRPDGTDCSPGEVGHLVLGLPLIPGSTITLYKNDELFKELYLNKFPGYFDTNDLAYFDENGLIVAVGRTDDVIKVSGHRLETTQIEQMVESHPNVVECAVIGKPDEERFQVPLALYVTISNHGRSPESIHDEIMEKVVKEIGPSGDFFKAVEVPVLPKNANGKILRSAITQLVADGVTKVHTTVECAEDFDLLQQSLQDSGMLPQ